MAFVHFGQKKLNLKLLTAGVQGAGHQELFANMTVGSAGALSTQQKNNIQVAGLGVLQLEAVKLFDFETNITMYCIDLGDVDSFPRGILAGLDAINFVFDRRLKAFTESMNQFAQLTSFLLKNATNPVITIHYNNVDEFPAIAVDILESEWNTGRFPSTTGSCADFTTAADTLMSTLKTVMSNGQQYVNEIRF